MPFENSIVAGSTLVRPAIKSPNYVTGVSGWSINKDGTAEFSNALVRGTFVAGGGAVTVNSSGVIIVVGGTTVNVTSAGFSITNGVTTVQATLAGVSVVTGATALTMDTTKFQVTNGTTTVQASVAGVSVVTGTTALTMDTSKFQVTNGTTTVVTNATGLAVTAGAVTVTVNTTGVHVVSGGSTFEITTAGFNATNGSTSVVTNASGQTVTAGTTVVTTNTTGFFVSTPSATAQLTGVGLAVVAGTTTVAATPTGFTVNTPSAVVTANGSGFSVVSGTISAVTTAAGGTVYKDTTNTYQVAINSSNVIISDTSSTQTSILALGSISHLSPTNSQAQLTDVGNDSFLQVDDATLTNRMLVTPSVISRNGVPYKPVQSGVMSFTAAASSTVTGTVTFPIPFTSAPAMSVNVLDVPGSTVPRDWVARATTITTTGCTVWLYSVTSVPATFTSRTVQWIATGN